MHGQASLGKAGDVGFKQAMQQKWIKLDKSGGEAMVHRAVDSVTDTVLQQLETVAVGGDLPASDVATLKKRKLVTPE